MDTIVSERSLRALTERLFEREGFSGADACVIADVLMLADLFGIESHGAQRMLLWQHLLRHQQQKDLQLILKPHYRHLIRQ